MISNKTQAALRAVSVLVLIAGTALLIHCPKPNLPPGVPEPPSGITHGTIGTSYEFSAFAIDPDHNDVALRFAWGDGDTSEWSVFVPSGDTVTMSHAWAGPGEYPVRAQAQDRRGAESDWSEPHQVTITGEPAIIKWRYETEGPVVSCPAIGADGTVYIGTHHGLYALNPDGTLRWRYPTRSYGYSSPAVADDGTVLVGSEDSCLYAVSPDGTLKWYYRTDGAVRSSPAVADDGTVYVGSWGDYLYAVNPDGMLRWRSLPGRWFYSTPAIAFDGTVYVGSDSGLYAVNPDGTIRWRSQFEQDIYSPVIAAGGTVYGTADGLYAINPDGSLKWHYSHISSYSSPAIAVDGTVYVGLASGYLYAFNPDGSLRWRFDTGGWISLRNVRASAVAADGTVYVESADTCLFALNPDGTLKWRYETDQPTFSPAIAADGTVYFGSGSYLYAITGAAPLADSPWPKFGGDSRNTGRVSGR